MENSSNKNMTLKKQLMAAIAMLLVAAVALASATYAWFVNNKTVDAKGMTVNAKADPALLIKGSTDTSYSAVGTNAVDVEDMKPSTSTDGLKFASLGDNVKVKSESSGAATWSGTDGAFKDGDLVTVTAAGTYYVESEYDVKAADDGADSIDAYVSAITLNEIKDGDNTVDVALDKALRFSVTYTPAGTGKTSTTYVYANTGADNQTAGVGKFASDKWSLSPVTYKTISSTNSFTIDKTGGKLMIRIWYEGQDKACCTSNVNTNARQITVSLTKIDSTT